jgi:hypothetical protein
VVLLVVGIVVALAVLAAAVALWWLPPVLAETPRERFAAPATVTVQDASGSASVQVEAGWVPLGVGPFLSASTATLLSPDGVYRAELSLAPLPDAGDAAVSAALSTLLTAHGLSDADADAAAGTSTPTATGAARAAAGVRWSEETLTSGATVRYAALHRGDTTYTVAIVLPPADAAVPPAPPTPTPDAPAPAAPTSTQSPAATVPADATPPVLALTLVAATSTPVAATYRTVTADLVASATFARASSGSPTPPVSAPLQSGGAR